MKNSRSLFEQLQQLSTEQRNPRSRSVDMMPVKKILSLINREDSTVPKAVKKELPAIGLAVDAVVRSLRNGGRLFYVGAGTSGRLGVLDAAECPPTFGTDPGMVQGIIAGGKESVFRSREGVEDRPDEGRRQIRLHRVSRRDVVCGIAASFRTPFVAGAVSEAKRRGATTLFITTNSRSILAKSGFAEIRKSIDIPICIEVGPEVIMGSTRMKAGTAQKLALNMITTAAMIRLGKVYENMMVDLQMKSRKLEERAKRIVMLAAGVEYAVAAEALKRAGGNAKTAIVALKLNVSPAVARKRLRAANGFIRKAIGKAQ
jgi:N-acetylmuramic acid 6-phosphate etherase